MQVASVVTKIRAVLRKQYYVLVRTLHLWSSAVKEYDVKITVVKKLSMKDVFGSSSPKITDGWETVCPCLDEGAIFTSQNGMCPDKFCGWAFADIQRDMTHIRFGGSFPCLQEEGAVYSCCTDGLRPVVFKLERMV